VCVLDVVFETELWTVSGGSDSGGWGSGSGG
jgi:hypothetical protein